MNISWLLLTKTPLETFELISSERFLKESALKSNK